MNGEHVEICILQMSVSRDICMMLSLNPFLVFSDGMSAEQLLHMQRTQMLPADRSQFQRVIVHRRHLFQDALWLPIGNELSRHIHVTFVGEPAMDERGPLRELLHLLMTAIAANNQLFQGKEDCMPCSCPEHDRTSEGDLQVCGTNDGSILHPWWPFPNISGSCCGGLHSAWNWPGEGDCARDSLPNHQKKVGGG